MLAELLQHLEHYGEFLLGEHPNLEVKMRTALGFASHSVLAERLLGKRFLRRARVPEC
jgi:hypothetical protein